MKELTIISTVEITEVIKDCTDEAFEGFDTEGYKRGLVNDLQEWSEVDRVEVKAVKVFPRELP